MKIMNIIDKISTFIISFIIFSFGMLILFSGRNLYGVDATLLWASGILTMISLYGFVDAFRFKKLNKNGR